MEVGWRNWVTSSKRVEGGHWGISGHLGPAWDRLQSLNKIKLKKVTKPGIGREFIYLFLHPFIHPSFNPMESVVPGTIPSF